MLQRLYFALCITICLKAIRTPCRVFTIYYRTFNRVLVFVIIYTTNVTQINTTTKIIFNYFLNIFYLLENEC